jgi:hypothetical protein
MMPFQREICIIGLKFRGFWVATPPTLSVRRLDPLKALPYIMEIGSVVRAVREPEKIVNNKKKRKTKDTNVIFHVCMGTEPPWVA